MLVLKKLRTSGYPFASSHKYLISSFNNNSSFLKKIKIKGAMVQGF
jgi:predicted RNA-binding protein